MPNKVGNLYGLTTLCPVKNGGVGSQSFASILRQRLEGLKTDEKSPMAKIPNTYLCRLFLLDDVFFEGQPALLDHLKSSYLVFVSEFHGELEPYLQGAWAKAEKEIRNIWEHCVAFDRVRNAGGFVDYIRECQVTTTFLFNGSTDEPLDEQLKSLYLKQEFSRFAYESQGLGARDLQEAFQKFVERTQPANLSKPTWRPGASSLESAVKNQNS